MSDSLIFPVKNEATVSTVWFVARPTHYGCEVAVCKEEPHRAAVETWSWLSSAMAAVHVDYFVDYERQKGEEPPPEVVQIQLFDEQNGPYSDAHWEIPDARMQSEDASIVLVKDVQAWQAPKEDV